MRLDDVLPEGLVFVQVNEPARLSSDVVQLVGKKL